MAMRTTMTKQVSHQSVLHASKTISWLTASYVDEKEQRERAERKRERDRDRGKRKKRKKVLHI